MQSEKATFGAGCFWGVEETFRNIKGVLSTSVGYAGGTQQNPTYQDVCTDKTGHAEVVEVEFDPSQVSYDELLDIFWSNHNPTTLNRQGPDVGRQYRSVKEILPYKKFSSVAPLLRIGIERQPVNQEDRKGQKFFDERRVLRLETKVPCCKIRISRSEMHGLIISRRIGADEEYALNNKKENKE